MSIEAESMEAAPRLRLGAVVALLLFLAVTPPVPAASRGAPASAVPPLVLVARLRAFSVSLDGELTKLIKLGSILLD